MSCLVAAESYILTVIYPELLTQQGGSMPPFWVLLTISPRKVSRSALKMDHLRRLTCVTSSGNRQVVVTVGSTGTVRSRGELLRTAAVRLAMVGGLAVAAWLAGAVTANAAEASVRMGDPSPSAVSKQGEQPVDAPVRTDACGYAGECSADDPGGADAGDWTSANSITAGDPSAAAAQQLGSAAAQRDSALARTPSGVHAFSAQPQQSAQSDSGPSTRPAVPLAQPSGVWRPGAQLPAVEWSDLQWSVLGPVTLVSAPGAAAHVLGDMSVPGWSQSSGARPGSAGTASDNAPNDLVANQSTRPSCPDLAGQDGARAPSIQTAPAGGELGRPSFAAAESAFWQAHDPIRATAAPIANSPQPVLPSYQQAADSPGSPALPRPEPGPQPVSPAPFAPSAAPNGHPETGGPRGVIAVFPVQLAGSGPMLVDADRFGGSVLVPGVLHRPIVSPD